MKDLKRGGEKNTDANKKDIKVKKVENKKNRANRQ